MTPRRLASLCFRLLALAVFADMLGDLHQVVQYAIYAMTQSRIGGPGLATLLYAIPVLVAPALQLAFAAWLWRRSGVAAAWLFSYDLQDDPEEPDAHTSELAGGGLTPALAEAIAFSVLGAWVLCGAIPEGIRYLGGSIITADNVPSEYRDQLNATVLTETLALGSRIVLGVWLLFGAHGIVRLLRRLRGVGLEDTTE